MTRDHVDQSIARALKGESYLDPDVLKITGFSTATMRHLFSNLCHLEGIHYCEVGCYCGATLIAAFNRNPISATGIDDFSQDFSRKNVAEELRLNLEKWIPKALLYSARNAPKVFSFIESDCFQIPNDKLPTQPIDIFCYDGHHDREPTSRALPAFFDLLADTFIYIVDDIHWPTVAAGVQMGFETLAGRVKVEQGWKLSGKRRQDDPVWWNGVSIFLCSKIK